jgi:cyclopropane fatty-acyl-phospholipid synthase-like methyltransferase
MSSAPRRSLTPAYFEALYAKNADPWRFSTSDYERRKYAATDAALNGHNIRTALEVGCSIGIFTRQLARRCNVLAVDVAEQALVQARRNCEGLKQVRFERMQIPEEWPAEEFDLIVLSEVLYYLSPYDIRRTAARSLASLSPTGLILLVHWTGPTNYPCQGDEAVDYYLAACNTELSPLLQRHETEYRLDLLMRKS